MNKSIQQDRNCQHNFAKKALENIRTLPSRIKEYKTNSKLSNDSRRALLLDYSLLTLIAASMTVGTVEDKRYALATMSGLTTLLGTFGIWTLLPFNKSEVKKEEGNTGL